MFWQVFLFELKFRLKSKALWICWAVLTAKGVTDLLSAEWELMMPSRVPLNSPFSVYYLLMFGAFWSQILAVGFMAQPLLRDITTGIAPLVYSKPVTNRSYLLGKYSASLLGLLLVMTGPLVALILTPTLAGLVGIEPGGGFIATPWWHLLHAYVLWLGTSCVIFGSLHFALAACTGRIAPSYALAALVMILFLILTVNFENTEFDKPLMQILDPLGKAAVEAQIFYWSAEERTRNFVSVSGWLLLNRLLYCGLGLLALLLALWRFDLRRLLVKSRSRAQRKQPADTTVSPANAISIVHSVFTRTSTWQQHALFAVRAGWREFTRLFASWPFRMVVLMMLILTPLSALEVWYPKPEGALLPAGLHILKLTGEIVYVVVELAMLFFAGELLGREKSARVTQLVDATPMPTWALFLGKVAGVSWLAFFFTLIFPASALLVQILSGFLENNPLLYLYSTTLTILPNLLAMMWVAVFCYALCNDKTAAQIASIIFAFTIIILHETEAVQHHALQFALPPGSAWSDFETNTMAITRYASLGGYWLALAGLLIVISYWLWPRGTEPRVALRLRQVPHRWRPVSLGMAAACALLWVALGAWNYYNINTLNEYQSSTAARAERAEYEKKYAHLAALPQPKITDAKLRIDLSPQSRRAEYSATLTIQNKTQQPINELHLEYAEHVALAQLLMNGQALTNFTADETLRHRVYPLAAPLAPGQTATLDATLSVQYRGFGNEGQNGAIVPDGTVFTPALWPSFGYDRRREISQQSKRQEHSLPPRQKLPSVTSVAATPELARDLAANDDADFVTFEAVISTDADQIVSASGELVSDEIRNGKRVFTYRGTAAALWDLHFASARYAITQGAWNNGQQTVALEIFHHPRHRYNVPRLLEAAQFALTQLTKDFGAYPHRVLRFAEIPNGLPDDLGEPVTSGNLILLPEKKGWLHDYRGFDGGSLDFVQYLAAREIARGWWGQQAAPALVQGYPLLRDSMPIYAALSVLQARQGEAVALKQVAVLTDGYLRDSAIEDGREPAMIEAEAEAYLPNKGALQLFSARQTLGADRLHAALKSYLDATRARTVPPFTRADEFIAALKASSDNEQAAWLSASFTTTTVYDYKLKEARAVNAANHFKLQLQIEARKFQATDRDNRTETPLNEPLEVAVFAQANPQQPIFLQTPALKSGSNQIELEVSDKPVRVAIDPRRRLIDRNQMDNTASVRLQ